jgi:hypothetical protein
MMRCIARRLLQAANAIDTSGLLRTRRERPSSRRAVEKRNEFASSHRPAPQTGGSYPTMLWAALCITAYSGCRCPLWVRSGHHSTSKQCLLCLQERTSELPGFAFDVVALAAWRLPRSRAMHCMVSNRTFKSYGGASFGVVPRASWHAPCVMASLTSLLHRDSGGDTESYHDKDSQ